MFLSQSEIYNSNQKIPPINCILEPENKKGGLYLGNIFGAIDGELMRKFQIGAVLTVAEGTNLDFKRIPHLVIAVQDFQLTNLLQHFGFMLNFIDQYRMTTNVFVHCFAGVSRSATAVIAYIMMKYHYTML